MKNIKSVFTIFFMVADLLSPNRFLWSIAKVKNYNLNVTEVRDSDFKHALPGIFNFTVGILTISNWLFYSTKILRTLKIVKLVGFNRFQVDEWNLKILNFECDHRSKCSRLMMSRPSIHQGSSLKLWLIIYDAPISHSFVVANVEQSACSN